MGFNVLTVCTVAWEADINTPRYTVRECFREVDIPDNLGAREGPALWREGVRGQWKASEFAQLEKCLPYVHKDLHSSGPGLESQEPT